MEKEKLSYLDLAAAVSKKRKKPLTPKEMWEIAEKEELHKNLKTQGKTPIVTLASSLILDTRSKTGLFTRLDGRPAKYILKTLPVPEEIKSGIFLPKEKPLKEKKEKKIKKVKTVPTATVIEEVKRPVTKLNSQHILKALKKIIVSYDSLGTEIKTLKEELALSVQDESLKVIFNPPQQPIPTDPEKVFPCQKCGKKLPLKEMGYYCEVSAAVYCPECAILLDLKKKS